ncbi:MAG: DHH family phosphoesterase, partial [Candidatus Adiutrix sp.]|nr:DHH family phosphoesterase [Candidatus Adiutrix sp.]
MFNSRGNKKGASAVPGRRRPLVAPGGQGLSRLEASRHARVFSQLLDLIGASQKICLIGHAAPDGDSLMSCLALKTYLASQGKEADMVLDGQIPYNYDRYADSGLFLVRDHIGPYDLALALDSATPERLGRFKKLFMAARFKIVLDHHSTNSGFGNVNIIDSQVSSTCELIYHLLDFANYRLNKQIAEFLYIGILTDTGRFRYPAANGRTHRVVGALMDHGLKPDEIYGDIFRNKPAGLAQACGAAMAGLRLFAEGRAALAKITARTAELNNGRIDEI